MRLWHQELIPTLPKEHLLALHRECCALRGKGWGRKHTVVDYVFLHSRERLFAYHAMVMDEMARRGFAVASEWRDIRYCGRNLPRNEALRRRRFGPRVYREHDEDYLAECLKNLRRKGVKLLYYSLHLFCLCDLFGIAP